MIHIILGAIILSIIHATIPNHWLPFVAIGRVERWERRTTIWVTTICGMAHIVSTILIGILVGIAGYHFSTYRLLAPAILIGLGLIYLVRNFFKSHHHQFENRSLHAASMGATIISLSAGMFFSPCVELESYYFTAGTFGWPGIVAVSIVYLVVTVSVMVLLVTFVLNGTYRFQFDWLDKNEKAIIGMVLILIGIMTFLVHF